MSNYATALYAAKRELRSRFERASKVVGGPLEGVQVAYMRPGVIDERVIYLGSGRSTRGEADAEGELARETLVLSMYIRVLSVSDDVEAVELEVERLADAAIADLVDDPEITGDLSFADVLATIADVYPWHEQYEAVLGISIRLDSWLGVQ